MEIKEQARSVLEGVMGARPFSKLAPLVVGVSGGPDSLALLHVLTTIYPPSFLVAAHLNHGWRQAAETEAGFVRETAVSWGIECRLGNADVKGLAKREGVSLEEAGRLARYRFLGQVAEDMAGAAVAVAHHASDQVETILMHFLRGTSLAGLAGMAEISPMPGLPAMPLVRPFLHVSRSEIELYCRENELEPLRDPSNEDTTFLRNRIRHNLLPVLETYNPQIRQRILDLAALAAADEKLIASLIESTLPGLITGEGKGWIRLDRAAWIALPLSLRRRVLKAAFAVVCQAQIDISFRPFEQARLIAERNQSGSQANLPGHVNFLVDGDSLIMSDRTQTLPGKWPQLANHAPVSLPVPGTIILTDGWEVSAHLVPNHDLHNIRQNKNAWIAFVSLAEDDRLLLRPRVPGEKIYPLGLDGHSLKLKALMINRKIPARARPLWPILSTEDRLIWVPGHMLDYRARVTAASTRVVQLSCQQSNKS